MTSTIILDFVFTWVALLKLVAESFQFPTVKPLVRSRWEFFFGKLLKMADDKSAGDIFDVLIYGKTMEEMGTFAPGTSSRRRRRS